MPKTSKTKEAVKKKTNWKHNAGNKPPLREQKDLMQKRIETWQACLNQASLEPDPIEDLLVRNTLENMDIATTS